MLNPIKIIKFTFVIFFGLLLMLQFLSFPGQFRYMAEQEPDNAHLRWPLTALVFFIILAIEICVICLWKLIDNLINFGSRKACLRYLEISIAAIGFIWLVIAVVWLIVVIIADDPGMPVIITVIECAVTLVGLLYLVYRNHLRTLLSD
jgi:hypothetical protein